MRSLFTLKAVTIYRSTRGSISASQHGEANNVVYLDPIDNWQIHMLPPKKWNGGELTEEAAGGDGEWYIVVRLVRP